MRLNKFEKYFADKLDDYPSALDTNTLWVNLESDLEEKKRRRIIIILLTIFVLTAISALALYQYKYSQNQDVLSNEETIESVIASFDESGSLAEKIDKNENKASTESSSINTIKKQKGTQKKDLTIENNTQANSTFINPSFESTISNTSSKNQTDLIINHPVSYQENKSNPVVSNIQLDEIRRLSFSNLDILNSKIQHHPLDVMPRFRSRKAWDLSVTSNLGVFYTSRKFSQKSNEGVILKSLREGSENTMETTSLGLGIELMNKNNFFLTGGVHLNQMTERFDDQRSEFTSETIEIITEINYLSNGQREEVFGTFDQSQEIISTTRSYNTFRWMEFNIGAGYLFTTNRWRLGVNGGLLWGALAKSEGKILDAERNILNIESQDPSIYKENLGLGTYANLEARYTLKSRLKLSAQLGYKYMASSFTNDSYPLNINYQWWGATIGLRYKIN
jgi:hypothetical protein